VLCKNEAWQEANIVFQELLKWKLVLVGKIIETSGIWHLLQCNLFDWDWKVQNKEKFAKNLGTFWDPNFNIISYCAFKKFMRGNKMVFNYSYHIDPLQYIWFLTYAFVVTSSLTSAFIPYLCFGFICLFEIFHNWCFNIT
jgi:hypothetical protein